MSVPEEEHCGPTGGGEDPEQSYDNGRPIASYVKRRGDRQQSGRKKTGHDDKVWASACRSERFEDGIYEAAPIAKHVTNVAAPVTEHALSIEKKLPQQSPARPGRVASVSMTPSRRPEDDA